MKIVAACNAYKGSRTSMEAACDIERGIKRVLPDAQVVKLAVADGGDGTLEALVSALGGKVYEAEVKNPIGAAVSSPYAVLSNGKGVVEMSRASGLAMLDKRDRNPVKASAYGTGQLIKALLDKGVKEIIVGIGGSATNDGGTGIAEALGVKFFGKDGKLITVNGGNLGKIAVIDMSGLDLRLKDCLITVACDVVNPLYGPEGAAYVYAPQKGANPEQVEMLDQGLRNLAAVVHKTIGKDYSSLPGAGAAGGAGFGLTAFLNAKLLSGIETMLEAADYKKHLIAADLVITGEGMIDFQSAFGKVPAGVAAPAKQLGIPVIAIAGMIGEGAEKLYECGITAVIAISEGPCTLEYSMQNASKLISNCAERVMRIMEAKK